MISSQKENVSLKLSLVDSIKDGKEKIKSKTFANISFTAKDEAIHSLGSTMVSLQEKPLSKMVKVEETSLIQE